MSYGEIYGNFIEIISRKYVFNVVLHEVMKNTAHHSAVV